MDAAAAAALEAGHIINKLYEQPHMIRYKGSIDLVTEADTASEEIILEALSQAASDIPVLAEESSSGIQEIPAGQVWIVDPLDGTTNFAHGFPWFCISIALMEAGMVRLGVIYCPVQDELFCAGHRAGAWLNGRPIKTTRESQLSRSLLATGFPYDVQKHPDPVIASLKRMLTRAQGIRRAGAAAADLAYVACGRLDGFWEIKLKPWDTAAGLLLVEEAGGKVTDFMEKPYSPFVPEILASNGLIHEDMAALLRDFSGHMS